MRPAILNSLFASVTNIKGVGSRTGNLIAKVAGPRVIDLLWHLPTGLIERSRINTISEAGDKGPVVIALEILEHRPRKTERQPVRVICRDCNDNRVELVYFRIGEQHLNRMLPIGEWRIVCGNPDFRVHSWQILHPDAVVRPDRRDEISMVEPVYPLTAGLSSAVLGKAIGHALQSIPHLPEWQDAALLHDQGWPDWKGALQTLHEPGNTYLDIAARRARMRMACDELLANQLSLALRRKARRSRDGRSLKGTGVQQHCVLNAFPFTPTPAQTSAITEITNDMADPAPMLRLLQGDVGSGKTLVALFAMLVAIEEGAQAALLVPTDLLARQHFSTLRDLTRECGIEVVLFTGSDKSRTRDEKLHSIASGHADLIIGTHALASPECQFADLALVVVDEQHRFGVGQRNALANKGRNADVLVMTATPIPRTLRLTEFGDMDVTRVAERLPGRQSVDTRVIPLTRVHDVVAAIQRAVNNGNRAYWICPVLDESELHNITAATHRHESFADIPDIHAGLVHGRMTAEEKTASVERFVSGESNLLVATTVVEVGLDIPDATVMVVEHAERLGLAQLHQLRGRVGRSDKKGVCLLLYAPPLNETARARLEALRSTHDGFEIAEIDLTLRGEGEVFGTRQSGTPELRLADAEFQARMCEEVRRQAQQVVSEDPELATQRGQALRLLLYLFAREDAIRFLS